MALTYDVSQFPGAAEVYIEVSKPGQPFSNPNGTSPDPNRQAYGYGPPGRSGIYFTPSQSLPSWGTYYVRIVPIDANHRGLALLSNSSVLVLSPQ